MLHNMCFSFIVNFALNFLRFRDRRGVLTSSVNISRGKCKNNRDTKKIFFSVGVRVLLRFATSMSLKLDFFRLHFFFAIALYVMGI